MAQLTTMDRTVVIESGFDEFESAPLGMNATDMPYLIGLLANMYTNPEYAVLRELVANGIDSHRVNGNPDVPVKVTLPTIYAPYVVVADQGVGMSRDELVDIFCTVLTSSKRNDQNTIGAFGIGSKSPFSVAGSFTVDAVKDGHRVVVEISKDEDQTPHRTILSEGPTTQPSGVTITIPVSASQRWSSAAQRLFSTWVAGPVEVDGTLHNASLDDPDSGFVKVLDNIYHRPGDSGLHVVMAGIVYPVPEVPAPHGLYLVVEPGKIDLVPSRDAVMVNKRSRRVIDAILDEGRKAAEDAVAEAKAETDPNERLGKMVETSRTGPGSVFLTDRDRRDLLKEAISVIFEPDGGSAAADHTFPCVETKTLKRGRVTTSGDKPSVILADVLVYDRECLFVIGDDKANLRTVAANAGRILRYSEDRPEKYAAVFPTADYNGLRIDRLAGVTVLTAEECVEEGSALFKANRTASQRRSGAHQYTVKVADPNASADDEVPDTMPAVELREEIEDGSLVVRVGTYDADDVRGLASMLNQRVIGVEMGRAQVHTLHKRLGHQTQTIHEAKINAHREKFLAASEDEINDMLVAHTARGWARETSHLLFGYGRDFERAVFYRAMAERAMRRHGATSLIGRAFALYVEWMDDRHKVAAELDEKISAHWPMTRGDLGGTARKVADVWPLLVESVDQTALNGLLDKAASEWGLSTITA